MPRKQKELNLICYSKDGTRLKIDPKTGKFDPPFGPPEELQIEITQMINLQQNGIRVVKAKEETA
ncbi:hypothetical protein D922_03407 [Enterococcus faecalis 06-MB-DW-09]|nr:hypothetical protein D922_03407 [Enterococcus faecalis 06-MB-DW-09]